MIQYGTCSKRCYGNTSNIIVYRDEDITKEINDELLLGQGYVENVIRATGHLFR